jgi:methyl-accepting chemotaxis protein
LLLITASAREGLYAWRKLDTVRQTQAFDSGANRFIAGLFEILMERLATNNGLQAASPAGPETLAEITRRRATVQQNFDAGLATLQQFDFPNKAALMASLNSALTAANEARRLADRDLKLPREGRDQALLKSYVPTISASVSAALNVWFSTLHHSARNDAYLARLAVIKELGFRMRDVAGMERSNIGSAIAGGQPLSAAAVADNAGIRARVDLLWQQLGILMSGMDPAIGKAVEDAKAAYFGSFRTLADQMRKAGDEGAKYPITTSAWVDTTTPQLGTLLEVMFAAAKVSEAHTATLYSSAILSLTFDVTLLLIGIIVIIATIWIILMQVIRPLRGVTEAMGLVAKGQLATDIPYTRSRNEIGDQARTLVSFRDSLRDSENLRVEHENAKAASEAQQKQMMRDLADRFEGSVGGIVDMVSAAATQLQATATQMSSSVQQVSVQSTSVASAAEEAGASVTSVAGSAEELGASVHEIGRQVGHSADLARAAVKEADTTGSIVAELSQGAARIGDIVEMISNIASQTNLLALNATIEAARAGEAGRGFAVVASEVKSLAEQTSKATSDISAQINAIQDTTKRAVGAIAGITDSIQSIDKATSSIASAVEQQGAATSEIVGSVSQASSGTAEVSSAITMVAQAASEAGNGAAKVLSASSGLANQAERLSGEVKQFLATVRAA